MSNRPVGRPMGGRRMNRMGGGEKAKDFRGTIQKLLKYMSVYKVEAFFVLIFAVGGTVFNIVGPKIFGKATMGWIFRKSEPSF